MNEMSVLVVLRCGYVILPKKMAVKICHFYLI